MTHPPAEDRGFFSSLFDLSFARYVTPTVIQVYYVVALVVLGLMVLFGLIGSLVEMANGAPIVGLIQLIGVPVAGLVYLLLVRMGLELVSTVFRMGENIQAMRDKMDREG
ncbi:MAG TPA: DUF4282 domain-containing protein [Stackebrandtia sp.]|jgi:hypothetical protein|uniref:DUF4282 domain-containing protein n=1 Tax=Stackebrandtia sp. TaxID=2023065 RepID=UPI002D3DC4C1|nr:DUF4282 domain-containing protein [Stackebrandtia sp.]HZE39465.1 DUF4282 domain-containing protein [Stackebrandtia sp.]